MRFLYGDTEPFPLEYDFLGALEAFVANAARAVQLDAEVRGIREAAAIVEAARAKSVEALEQFHEGRMRSLAQHMPVDADAQVREYVRQLSELALTIVDASKAQSAQAAEAARQQTNAEIEKRRAEIRAALAAFLRLLRLPAVTTSSSMRLHDGYNDLSAIVHHADGIAISFAVATRDVPAWQAPRKVGEFAKGIDLPVGVRRSWFSKGVQNEMAHIDDYTIGGFELGADAAEIRLRKKPGDKDTLVFNVRRGDDGALSAEVHHPEDPEADGLRAALDSDARAHLERLWIVLRSAAEDVTVHRDRVLGVKMGEDDVVEADRVVDFVDCVIRQIAPTVLEIAKRSSNQNELSLKAENEKGRREEIYVKKAALAKHLEPLAQAERDLFAPLALVPGAPASAPAASANAPGAIAPGAAAIAPGAAAIAPPEKRPPQGSAPDDNAWDVDVSS